METNTENKEQNQQPMTQREILEQRMKKSNPEVSWTDEEAFFKAINDSYDERDVLQELLDEQAREHALALEAAVATAAHEGEVRGRNMKIEEELRRVRQPEHIHNLDGSPNTSAPKWTDHPALGALNRAASLNIWERGSERRISHDKGSN